MLILRLELWAEKSGTQFGFRTAFHQVLAAFLDISVAYDNVLRDILCRELKIPLVFLLWDMMRENHLYFFNGQDVAYIRTGYKGPPQGSVLSPFM
jgi:hypothetical protein